MSFELRLPATSANLGPAFDAAAVAMSLTLRLQAQPAEAFHLQAVGRDPGICGQLRDHLIVNVYRQVLAAAGKRELPLALRLDNEIPIGKGCGSSAAARLAGVALAAHFGELHWSAQQVFEAAVALEGHPDNVAACWWGGLVVARTGGDHAETRVDWLQVPVGAAWPLLLAVPAAPLATSEARRVLPAQYSRADAVSNLQNALLLLAAWQQGRGELLPLALGDRLHQPYRAALCPALPALLPLAGHSGILGVALSGAGPSVLMIVASDAVQAQARAAARAALQAGGIEAELLQVQLQLVGPGLAWRQS